MDNDHLAVGGGDEEMHMYSAPVSGVSTSTDTHLSNLGWSLNPSVISNDLNVQYYDQSHLSPWDGGPWIWDDKHDDFCYVCGSSMELFQCQTCSTSYHASCMSPTVSPSEVPDFWFCPHCVDRELHIPHPLPTNDFNPSPPELSRNARQTGIPSETSYHKHSPLSKGNAHTPEPIAAESSRNRPNSELVPPATTAVSLSDKAGQKLPKPTAAKGNTARPRRSYSPPRKKSKYSAFSSEVDKALTVIHKELEASAKVGKTEAELRAKIRMLEQELRLKDGQITLAGRELEIAKRNGGDSAGLRIENEELKMQVSRLERLVESKDSELRDWRDRLKSMIGD
ncbi:hypothetical protein VTL71DRAFT_4448 [Oculimacula yallundae]|uniref:PHD-type domain-containing protein n=1 Tax=Oculimacula yallundae TaxID=86028 RepID=A0ABR4C226_9HELO